MFGSQPSHATGRHNKGCHGNCCCLVNDPIFTVTVFATSVTPKITNIDHVLYSSSRGTLSFDRDVRDHSAIRHHWSPSLASATRGDRPRRDRRSRSPRLRKATAARFRVREKRQKTALKSKTDEDDASRVTMASISKSPAGRSPPPSLSRSLLGWKGIDPFGLGGGLCNPCRRKRIRVTRVSRKEPGRLLLQVTSPSGRADSEDQSRRN